MINNHEFLADENVVNNHYEVKSYQHLILDEIAHHQNYQLTHQFNFITPKKRFIMMTKSTSKSAHLKKDTDFTIVCHFLCGICKQEIF